VAKKREAFAYVGKRRQEVFVRCGFISILRKDFSFSLAGQTVSDQRTKLDPINVDKIVTLRANLRFLEQPNPIDLETEEETTEREVTFKCFQLRLEVFNKNN
jgi:hypothetical protein